MTTIIITIIATLFVHSAIAVIIYYASNRNEEYLAYWAIGIIGAITNGISAIVYLIHKAYKAKYFKALLKDIDGNLYYCDSKKADDYRCGDIEEYADLDLVFARDIVDKYKITDGWCKSDCRKCCDEWTLSARYVPLKICIIEGAKKI